MARKSPFAKVKFEERMLQQINTLLRRDFKDPRLTMVTVTKVELSQDYSYAKVYWDTFDSKTRGDAKVAIEGIAGKLRTRLAENLNVRHTPSLKFEYNAEFEASQHIDDLLKGKSVPQDSMEEDDDLDDDEDFDDEE
jgi:ribosome-binding factor A